MEDMVKKYQQKFKKVRDDMNRWDELQSRLISHIRNATSIIERLQEEFNVIVLSIGKTLHDGRQLVKGGSVRPTAKQLQQRIGIKPSLADCLEGLRLLHEMHQSDASDLGSLQQLLIDQPNIPKEEVQDMYDIVFAEEMC